MVCNENVCENEKYKGKLKPRYGSAVYDSVIGILIPTIRWDDLYNTTRNMFLDYTIIIFRRS